MNSDHSDLAAREKISAGYQREMDWDKARVFDMAQLATAQGRSLVIESSLNDSSYIQNPEFNPSSSYCFPEDSTTNLDPSSSAVARPNNLFDGTERASSNPTTHMSDQMKMEWEEELPPYGDMAQMTTAQGRSLDTESRSSLNGNNYIQNTTYRPTVSAEYDSGVDVFISKRAVVVDSPPMSHVLDRLKGILQRAGITFDIKLYKKEQVGVECGYIAVCSVFHLREPDWEDILRKPSLLGKPEQVIKLFNKIIECGNLCAIRLSDIQIRNIITHMEFLDVNFHLKEGLLGAPNVVQYIREIKRSLEDASKESNDTLPESTVSFRASIDSIGRMLNYCIERAKNGNFKTMLQIILNALKSGKRLDYLEVKNAFSHLIERETENLNISSWFAGVFSISAFEQHLRDEASNTDRDAVISKCAIVNTNDSPGQHWIAVAYEIKTNVYFTKATS